MIMHALGAITLMFNLSRERPTREVKDYMWLISLALLQKVVTESRSNQMDIEQVKFVVYRQRRLKPQK